jgi:hypothetical protein
MPATGPLHPVRGDGSVVDATFELTTVGVFEIVYHHKAGARASPRSVNADYHEGLDLLLARLASAGVSILGIALDSGIARELDAGDRELDLPFPMVVTAGTDVAALRLDITRAQKPVARRKDAKPGGGNDQKRIRITVVCDDQSVDFDRMRTLLVGTEATLAS